MGLAWGRYAAKTNIPPVDQDRCNQPFVRLLLVRDIRLLSRLRLDRANVSLGVVSGLLAFIR